MIQICFSVFCGIYLSWRFLNFIFGNYSEPPLFKDEIGMA